MIREFKAVWKCSKTIAPKMPFMDRVIKVLIWCSIIDWATHRLAERELDNLAKDIVNGFKKL